MRRILNSKECGEASRTARKDISDTPGVCFTAAKPYLCAAAGARPMDFWIWILVLILAVVGMSVGIGAALTKRRPKVNPREDKMMALKASGALHHRKSNRP